MIGSVANLQNDAQHLSVQQLQQAMRDGSLPAYIGMPILQDKVQKEKQAQIAMQGQQAAPQSIAQQIEGEAQNLHRPQAPMPQGVNSLPSNLPEEYAQGGIIGFAKGSQVPESRAQTIGELIEEAMQRKLASEYNPTGWTPEAVESYQPWERPIASRELAPYTGQGTPEYPASKWVPGQRVPDENVIRLGDMNNPTPTGTPRPPQFQSVAQGSQVGAYTPPTESVSQPQGISGLLGKDAVSGEYIPNAAQNQSRLGYERAPIEGETVPLKYGKTQKEYEEAMRKWRADRAERAKYNANAGQEFEQKLADAKAATTGEPIGVEPIAEPNISVGEKGINLKQLGGASLKTLSALSLPDLIDTVTGQPADKEDLDKYAAIKKSQGIKGVLQEMNRAVATSNADIANKIQGDVISPTKNWLQTQWSGEEGQQAAIARANAAAAEKHGVPVEVMNGLSATESSNNPNAVAKGSSAAGAHQITKGTWNDFGTNDLNDRFNPFISADIAGGIMARNIAKYPNDLQKAVAAYHLGSNAAEDRLAADTAYTNKVLGQAPQPQPQPQQGIQTPFAIPEAPQQNYSMPDFSALKRPETPAAEYQKQMQQALGDNVGLGAIKDKLAKLEEEGASAKEKAPWMALMQAGLGTMAGTSPFALTNIGQGGIAGLKAYTEAQDKLDKGEEKRLEIESQLANAQRAEQVAAWKYGVDSNKADVAENKAVGLAEAKAKIDAQQNKNKDALDLYKAQLGVPAEQAKAAYYNAHAAQQPTAANLSDYEGAKKVAMDNPTAPQYAKYFKTDPSGKPVWDELSFRSDYSKKEVIDKTPIADLYKIISESYDPHMVDLATKKLQNVLGDNKAPQVGVKEGWKVTRD